MRSFAKTKSSRIISNLQSVMTQYVDNYKIFNSLHAWLFFMPLLSCTDILKRNVFKKLIQEHYQCQVVWIHTKVQWIQSACKGYQQMTKVNDSEERVKAFYHVTSVFIHCRYHILLFCCIL